MQQVACPSCGAQVAFKSHASVMAVCEYCKTTVLKDADTVKDMGRMSDVLEDYSPIQIGTSGQLAGRSWTVIGRIQLRYDAGLWNEWYIMFDGGEAAWLGDFSGLYTLTVEKKSADPLPAFEDLHPAETRPILGKQYLVAEVRTAQCVGGQGELPFQVGQGWQARVADLRSGKSFLTLDYSDDGEAKAYVGQAVTLDQLKCQLLRDNDVVAETAGKVKGKVAPLECPSCGSPQRYVPGLTREIICPACRAHIDTTATQSVVLEVADRVEKFYTSLEMGAKATISGSPYEVIGLVCLQEEEEAHWVEYLLHSPRAGFLWLVETDDGWYRAQVQDEWPSWDHGETVMLGTQKFSKLYDYEARVVYAAGAFNWRVKVGDVTHVFEFESGKNRLAAELTGEELNWSMSSPVAADQIRAWFGKDVKADKLPPHEELEGVAKYFLYGLGIVNAIPLLMEMDTTIWYFAFAAAAIYLPALVLGKSEVVEADDDAGDKK
jgi:hypothetical protein